MLVLLLPFSWPGFSADGVNRDALRQAIQVWSVLCLTLPAFIQQASSWWTKQFGSPEGQLLSEGVAAMQSDPGRTEDGSATVDTGASCGPAEQIVFSNELRSKSSYASDAPVFAQSKSQFD